MAAVKFHGKRMTKTPRMSHVAKNIRQKRREETSVKQHRKKVFGSY